MKTQTNKKIYKTRLITIFTIILLTFIFVSSSTEIFAAKRKKRSKRKVTRLYNKKKTKAEAIEILKSSEEVSELAGLEATKARNSTAYIDVNLDTISHRPIDSVIINNNSNSNKTSNLNTTSIKTHSDIELLKHYINTENEEGEEGENIEELEAEDDVEINIDDFRSIWLLSMGCNDNENEKTSFGQSKSQLMSLIMNWFGIPYKFGGRTSSGIDCSAWVQEIFYESCNALLPRTAREQVLIGRKVKREKLELGDLVFFHTYSRRFASHVGIYLGDNLFAHASSHKGVTVSSLESTFYNNRFICGRRLSTVDIDNYKIASSDKITTNSQKEF